MNGNRNIGTGQQPDSNAGRPFAFQNHAKCPFGGSGCGGSGGKSRAKFFGHLNAHF
jgi:hypothetical protein